MIRNLTLALLALSTLSLTACGKDKKLELGQFAPYVEKFEQTSTSVGRPIKVDNLIMQTGDTGDPRKIGVCEISDDEDETPTITIRNDAWSAMPEDERIPLVFHELGHCVLHRQHRADVTTDGIPASLMNPYTMDGTTYDDHVDYYAHELFLN